MDSSAAATRPKASPAAQNPTTSRSAGAGYRRKRWTGSIADSAWSKVRYSRSSGAARRRSAAAGTRGRGIRPGSGRRPGVAAAGGIGTAGGVGATGDEAERVGAANRSVHVDGPPADHRGRDAAPQRPAVEGGVAGQRAEPPRIDGDREIRGEHGDVGRRPFGQGAALHAEDSRRAFAESSPTRRLSDTCPAWTSRSRQTDTAVSSPTTPNAAPVELGELLVDVPGRVVGGHAVDGAVGETVQQRLDVGRTAQRRVILQFVSYSANRFVGQGQVVRGDLAGHPAPRAAFPDRTTRSVPRALTCARWTGAPRQPAQRHVPPGVDLLRRGRHAAQPQERRRAALVGDAVDGQRGLLAMVD